MTKMALRKTILLLTVAVLAVIYSLQLVLGSRNKIQILSVEQEIDSIEIARGESTLKISLDGTKWIVGEKNYPADESKVSSMLNALKEIKTLGTVAKNAVDDSERYGLDGESAVVVSAYGKGNLLRKIRVGKNTSTSTQSYVSLDENKSVQLAQGALNTVFSVTEDSLRSRRVFKIDADTVSSVKVKTSSESYEVVRANGIWVPGPALADSVKLDSKKVTDWVNTLCDLNVSSWKEEVPSKEADTFVTILAGGTEYTLGIFHSGEDEVTAVSSAVEYPFTLSKYIAAKYEKKLSELTLQSD